MFPRDGDRRLLVWDACRVHLTDRVKEELRRRNVDTAVIPGGMTSLLQPLDVAINRPMKVHLRSQWTEWMISGKQEFLPSGKRRPPSRETVLSWIAASWKEIDTTLVKKSFLQCGISNAMDGTQDDELFVDCVATRDGDSTDSEDDCDIPVPSNLFEESDTEFDGFKQGVDY